MKPIERCPVCGAAALALHVEKRSVTVPYGPSVAYDSHYYQCGSCEEPVSADEDEHEKARQEANAKSIQVMLDQLNEQSISTSYFERALRIPQRTAARWKSGNFSAAALALLRTIRTYPWLLRVADADFKPEIAYQALIGAATTASEPFKPSIFITHGSATSKQEIPTSNRGNGVTFRNARPEP